MSTLQELFIIVKNFGLKVRTSGAKGDIAWENIKPFYLKIHKFVVVLNGRMIEKLQKIYQ
jgi:hypothetical protein